MRPENADVEGTVEHLETEARGEHKRVIRFRLKLDDGRLQAVEMSGETLSGVLVNGDRVSLSRASVSPIDGTARPACVWNRSSESRVELAEATRKQRFARFLGIRGWPTLAIGALFGAIATPSIAGIVKLLPLGDDIKQNPGINPVNPERSFLPGWLPGWVVPLALLIVTVGLIGGGMLARLQPFEELEGSERNRSIILAVTGVVIGVCLGVGVILFSSL